MDTRTKIITSEQAESLARESSDATVITGHFDVLLLAHARELDYIRAHFPDALLFVALTAPEQPLLSDRARAELVAALAVVDYVVSLEERQMATLLAAFRADRIIRLEATHERQMRELIQHAHRRQSS